MDTNTQKAFKRLLDGDVSKDDIVYMLLERYPDIFLACCSANYYGKVTLPTSDGYLVTYTAEEFTSFNYFHEKFKENNEKVACIKALREHSSTFGSGKYVGLKEAKEIVEKGTKQFIEDNPKFRFGA